MVNKLKEYLVGINIKDSKIINDLNKKYSIYDISEIVYRLYYNEKLDHDSLKNIISMSLTNDINFKVSLEFLMSIIENKDIISLKLILNNYLYNNNTIQSFLFLYKNRLIYINNNNNNNHLLNADIKNVFHNEKSNINLNTLTKDKKYSPLSYACQNGNENIVKLLIE